MMRGGHSRDRNCLQPDTVRLKADTTYKQENRSTQSLLRIR
jgi:hypothetical protein